MTEKTTMERILEDLALRETTFAGAIVIDNATGQLKVITYDARGLVDTITQGDNAIALYGKVTAETSGMRELFTLTVPAGGKESK